MTPDEQFAMDGLCSVVGRIHRAVWDIDPDEYGEGHQVAVIAVRTYVDRVINDELIRWQDSLMPVMS